jgi:CheY-like chemotaxis protein
LSAKRILLVEDEFLVRLTLAEALVDAGFEVAEAENGVEAERLITGPDHFDMVVTDVQMPGDIDGVALVRRVREIDPGIPVIYMTGIPDSLLGARPLGPLEIFIPKPYGPSEMLQAIRGLFEKCHGG